MSKIIILPENVKNMIAAGEVVAGPYSVIKELVENSIDAGCSEIEISVFESGMKKIIVRDNGSGISKDDLPLAIREHATSKIRDVNDIYSITSYGFRGEALASIASIAKLCIMSKEKNLDCGGKLSAEFDSVEFTDYFGEDGTTVIVENLFYNTPARKKFLKSLQSEKKLIRETIYSLALSRPELSFRYSFDGTAPSVISKTSDEKSRISDLYDYSMLLEGEICDVDVSVKAFISKPSAFKKTRSDQYLFVNRRPIEYKYLNYTLKRAYEGFLSDGYPQCFFYININPSLIDVNIHPAKKEIKFFDSKYIDSMIYSTAKKILGSRIYSAGNVFEKSVSESSESFKQQETEFVEKYETEHSNISLFSTNSKIETNTESTTADISSIYNSESNYKSIGTIFGKYIIAEKENSVYFIDFHAAHERMLFDAILAKNENIDSFSLIFSEKITLPKTKFEKVSDNLEEFRRIGFDIDTISDDTFAVSAIPSVLQGMNIHGFIDDFAESAGERFESIREMIAAKAACHSAKRANDIMTNSDIKTLIDYVFNSGAELRCPHGRPFVFNISEIEFEKMFRRSK
ncbi:MAG TPA: DNA mismatch repair endonuclease MutL [Spirochaetota bacterium]|nr:DNA mismatch repair endonuclease MutL [Spirochaetota bacterium]